MKFQQKKEDKIYLLIKNTKINKKTQKLDYIKIRIFFNKTKKRVVSYKLKLF